MISEQQRRRALGSIREVQRMAGRRSAGNNDDTYVDNMHRMRALEGVCGDCQHGRVEFKHKLGRERVELHCERGLMPVDMYKRTNLGQVPVCPKFLPK